MTSWVIRNVDVAVVVVTVAGGDDDVDAEDEDECVDEDGKMVMMGKHREKSKGCDFGGVPVCSPCRGDVSVVREARRM